MGHFIKNFEKIFFWHAPHPQKIMTHYNANFRAPF